MILPATLQELTAGLAARGDAPALITVGKGEVRTWSYAALAGRSRGLAAALARRGGGEPVAIIGPNGPAWVMAFLAIVASGGTVVPLDERSGAEDLHQALARSGCRRAFASTRHEAALRAAGWRGEILPLDETASAPEIAEGDAAAFRNVTPEDLAVLAFTSGTTGTPKAVPLSHANIAANLAAMCAERLIGQGDCALLPLPLHHIYPLTVGLLTPLASGAAVVLPSAVGGPELVEALRLGRATHMLGVPRLYEALLAGIRARIREGGTAAARLFGALLQLSVAVRRRTGARIGRVLFRGLHGRLAPDLRLLVCGGAPLDEATERALEGIGWEVLTGYGLTETSPILTFNRRGAARPGSAGQAVAGVRVRIAHPDAQGIGEIEATGASVFAGYHDDPAATAAAFTADGWFRTGDLGRLDAGGYLWVVARAGETIVLPDGKKVFPETLESAYERSPFVREVAVLATSGGLAALVVPDLDALRRAGTGRIEDRLRDELAVQGARLPPWQRLQGFAVSRAALPRTHLGKIRRHLLPDLYAAARERRAPEATPELSPEDRALLADPVAARLWDWLKARFPGRTLSLDTSPQIDLGLDSLGWVGLSLEIRAAAHIDLTESAVSRVVTLRDLLREAIVAGAAPDRETAAADAYWFERRGPMQRALRRLLVALNQGTMRLVFRLAVEGEENLPASGPCVVCPNHASFLDPFAVAAALPACLLRDTFWGGWTGRLFTGPVTRRFSRIAQAIPVDPDRTAATSLALGVGTVRAGKVLVWFPEGARSPTGELQRFHLGIGAIIAQTRAPAIPVLIRGSFECWPRGKLLPRPGRITVRFGAPLAAEALAESGMGESQPARIADALHAAVASMRKRKGN